MLKLVYPLILVISLLVISVYPAKIPNEDEGRVHHDHKLSDQDHYVDTNNDKKMEHNVDYDHDAFLGKEEAEKFKTLSPEESKERLGIIAVKIDKDLDGFITEGELSEWLKSVTKANIMRDVDKKWTDFSKVNTLDDYLKHYYGALDYWSDEEKEKRKDDYKVYLKLMERDKKKFKAADLDSDGRLNKLEFADFLHPEESIHMREIVINETIEDVDRNNDGVIDLNEYLGDIYRIKTGEDDELAKTERDNFQNYRDKNGDNVLDREEVAAWIMPTDYDHTLNEAKHLIFEADDNKDGKLTKEEVLNNFNLFVSSRATSYGQDIYEKEDL